MKDLLPNSQPRESQEQEFGDYETHIFCSNCRFSNYVNTSKSINPILVLPSHFVADTFLNIKDLIFH